MAYCIFKEGDVHRVATRRGRRCSRHVAYCGLLFLVLCQASGCGDNASPPAPTPPPVAANHSPVASAAVIPDQALPSGRNAATVDMAPYFTDLDGDTLTYTAVSSDTGVVIVSVSLSTVMLTPVSAGATTVAVTAMDPGGTTATRSIAVTVGQSNTHGGPDLVVESPGVSSPTVDPEAEFTLSAPVTNSGDADAATTTLRYYRSTDATITTSDTEVGTVAVGPLAAGETSVESIDLMAPASAGTYYYGACVDAVTGESSTMNNCSGSVVVTVLESLPQVQTAPDLAVGSSSVTDESPEMGGSFTLSAPVTNSGDADAATTTLRYYRSTDATITTSDTEVGTVAVGPLAAGETSVESIDLMAPASAGTYYYGACVDAVTGESSTMNNCSGSVVVTVLESLPQVQTAPDLAVGSSSVTDESPEMGGSFTLSAPVTNSGDADAATTTLRYYRSTDATITTSDTEVGTVAVGPLAAGETSVESIDLMAPASAGTYYYGACVDAVTGESSTMNNCSGSVVVTVLESLPQVQTAPDLAVGSSSVTDESPEMGGSFTLSAPVTNSGDADAATTTLRYYRSTDATITTSDTEVGTVAVGPLAAGETSVESIDLTAPASAGTYYYGACVDAVTGESSTMNNCSGSVVVTVLESLPQVQTAPDLAVGSSSVTDESPEMGGSFTLSAPVTNSGDADAATTTLRYYRSTDATITTSDTEVGTVAVGPLAAGETSVESIDLTAPASAGTYYYGACVDAVTGESSTMNNCSGSVVVTVLESLPQVQTAPDLAVGSSSVTDESPEMGGSFTLSAPVTNSGDADAATTTLRYYRSTDATITTSDTEVGTVAVGPLAAGETSVESIDLTAPASAGTYYYGACVDAVTGESSTMNNCSGSVVVTVLESLPQVRPHQT